MASHIERRKFLAALGGAAAAWPLAVRAQQRPAAVTAIGTHRRSSDVRSYVGCGGNVAERHQFDAPDPDRTQTGWRVVK